MNPIAQQIMDRIIEHGHTFIGVFDPEGLQPSFTYSIGMTARGWPELLIIGNMPPRLSEYILTEIAHKWYEAGTPVLGRVDDIIATKDDASLPLLLRKVDPEIAMRDYAFQVGEYYEDAYPKQFVQVLWPDTAGALPTEPHYETKMTQPLLPEVA